MFYNIHEQSLESSFKNSLNIITYTESLIHDSYINKTLEFECFISFSGR